jgi:phage tail sheath gpL-like
VPNQNLTSAQVLPGFFSKIDYNAQGAGQQPNRSALLFGFISSSAQALPNKPFRPASQQEADDMCGGAGTDLARAFAAAVSQPESQGADVWLMPISENSGGVASVYKLKVFVSNTNPSKPGTLQLWVASRPVAAVGFTTSDTNSSIASALADAINDTSGLPFGTATPAGAEVTIPYIHKGTTGEDLPFQCNISPSGSGVQLSPGQITVATAATGAGSVRVAFGALSISTAISNADTAAQIATKIAASFNADKYPLYAAVDSTPQIVDLFFSNNMDVRRISAAVITTTGTTVNLGSGATDGTGSPTSLTYNGTLGTGAPSVSLALTNLAAGDSYRSWMSPWVDSATVGAMATAIEAMADGSISGQKQQHLTCCSPLAASVAGALAPACSPNLNTSDPHYAVLWSPDCAVQGLELAARAAAARAAFWLDAPQKNWNGFQLKGNSNAPLLLSASKPSLLAQNSALFTYALAPVVNGPSGNLEIVKGRTTSLSTNRRLWAWSIEAQAAYHAVDLASYYRSLFNAGSIVIYSDPKAPGLFDAASITAATQTRMRFWEKQGNFDGADALADSVKTTVDLNNPSRFNVEYPENGVVDLDQIVFTGHVSSPSV